MNKKNTKTVILTSWELVTHPVRAESEHKERVDNSRCLKYKHEEAREAHFGSNSEIIQSRQLSAGRLVMAWFGLTWPKASFTLPNTAS